MVSRGGREGAAAAPLAAEAARLARRRAAAAAAGGRSEGDTVPPAATLFLYKNLPMLCNPTPYWAAFLAHQLSPGADPPIPHYSRLPSLRPALGFLSVFTSYIFIN